MSERDELLERLTGHNARHWVERVQALIWEAVIPGTDEVHPECDANKWMTELATEVVKAFETQQEWYKKIGTPRDGDGNIAIAWCMATIMAVWAARISRAKAYDPNRPLDVRHTALVRQRENVMAVIDALINELHDNDFFPQAWNPPYGSSARGGDFR